MEDATTLPRAFLEGKTLEAWCEILETMHGIKLSARTVRRIAHETNSFFCLGRNILLTKSHVNNVIEVLTRRSNHICEKTPPTGGPGERSNTTIKSFGNSTEQALGHLQKLVR